MQNLSEFPRVSIVILNWNGWKDTIECLESLYQINYPNYDVILVDNSSEDESISKIKEYCKGELEVKSDFFNYNSQNKPLNVLEYTEKEAESIKKIQNSINDLILIKNEENHGFAEGNNIGMRYALNAIDPDYILLLNNDIVVDKDFLKEMVKIALTDDKIGFVGPKIYYYDYKGRKDVINFAGGKLNLWNGLTHHIGLNELDNGQYDKIKEVDYIEGSCILVRSEMIKKIGLIDKSYFTYWEENDWCIRGYNKGYKSIYSPKSKIWHKVSASDVSEIKSYYMARNRIWFMKKYAPKKYLLTFLFYLFTFGILTEIIDFLRYKNTEKLVNLWKGIKDGLIS